MMEFLIRSMVHPGVDSPYFFKGRVITQSYIVIIFIVFMMVPSVCSGLPSGLIQSHQEPITISVSQPTHESVIWIDVVPPHVPVIGEVTTLSGIKDIFVTRGGEIVSCGCETKFACSVPVSAGMNSITVIATDNLGNRVEKTLNVTVHIGLPPPPAIHVSGKVHTRDGIPVPDACVKFESVLELDNKPLSVSNLTGADGNYSIINAAGYRQTVIVLKDGYLPYKREVVFESQMNNLDLVIEPIQNTVPGFDLLVCVPAFIAALLIFYPKKR